jgi:phenylacetate-coenzyme A ligase PaaK-like adenylate-forming protein
MVQEWQLELIRQVFPESRIFAHYGVAEGVMLGGWWEEVEKYHFMPIYGVVERNPENGALIGSSLIHDALMLIRYQTSDVVSWLSSPAANGPAHLFPVAEALEGRLEDYTYNVRGEAISPALVTFPFKDLTTITGCKIIQWEERRIEILVETGRSRSEIAPEMDVAINGLRVLYGDEMQFDITIVERFEVSRSGKFKWIDCRIQRES